MGSRVGGALGTHLGGVDAASSPRSQELGSSVFGPLPHGLLVALYRHREPAGWTGYGAPQEDGLCCQLPQAVPPLPLAGVGVLSS